jgi:uncharacterized membrane protein YdbT with pleckstrin-like domain
VSEVLYEAHPSMIRMNPFSTVVAILAVPLAAIGSVLFGPPLAFALIPVAGGAILVLLYWYVATKQDHLTIKADEIVWEHGLLNKKYTEINMSSVRTARVSQNLLQRILDAGDIEIYTAGDNPELVVRGLPRPNAIREFIKGQPLEQG